VGLVGGADWSKRASLVELKPVQLTHLKLSSGGALANVLSCMIEEDFACFASLEPGGGRAVGS